MAIQYILIERENPLDREAPKKFYATSVKRGLMGMEELAERISGSSTASEGDILLVLTELSKQLRLALTQGYAVKIPGLGSFRVTLNGIGSDTAEEFTVNLVRGPKIRYLPEVDLMDCLSRTSLEKAPLRGKDNVDAGGGDDGSGETPGA